MIRPQRTLMATALALGFATTPLMADDKPNPSQTSTAKLDAEEAGARFGQALGALEVCYGSKMTPKGKALEATYEGGDLQRFKARAARVYEAWVKVRGCANQRDPNTCKIIMDRSCQMAEAEIGPAGNAMAGLVEFLKH